MNKGVEILIARIRTNPEDFNANGRFYNYVYGLERLVSHDADEPEDNAFFFLAEDDRAALRDAWREKMGDDFTARVMEDLIRDQEEVKMLNTARKQTKSMGAQNTLSPQYLQNEYARQLALNQAQNSVLGTGQGIGNGGTGYSSGFPNLLNKPPF